MLENIKNIINQNYSRSVFTILSQMISKRIRKKQKKAREVTLVTTKIKYFGTF
jgi:hypothetical protein